MNTKLPADMAAIVRTYMLPFACDRDATLNYLETLIDKKHDADRIECVRFNVVEDFVEQFLYKDIYDILPNYLNGQCPTCGQIIIINRTNLYIVPMTTTYVIDSFIIAYSIKTHEKIIQKLMYAHNDGPRLKYSYDNVYNMWIDKSTQIGTNRCMWEILIFTRDIEAWRRRTKK